MTVILVYLCLNIVLAATLERNNRSVSTILHAILFTFTALVLVLCSDNGIYSETLRNTLGDSVYDIVLNAVHCTSVFVPFVVVEFVIVLQAVIVAFIMACHIVEYLEAGTRVREAVTVDTDNLGRTPPVHNLVSFIPSLK